MFDISRNYFVDNPVGFLLGNGYYNYFSLVKEELYKYEIVRFFQPPHNFSLILIWQYGFISLLYFLGIFVLLYKKLSNKMKSLVIFLVFISIFDHYLFTNHQIKILLFLIFMYSFKKDFLE